MYSFPGGYETERTLYADLAGIRLGPVDSKDRVQRESRSPDAGRHDGTTSQRPVSRVAGSSSATFSVKASSTQAGSRRSGGAASVAGGGAVTGGAVTGGIRTQEREKKVRRRKPKRRTELGLLVLVALIIAGLYTILELDTRSRPPAHLGVFIGALLGVAFVAHMINRFLAPDASAAFLPLAALGNGLGGVMILRIDPAEAKLQAVWTGVSLILYGLTLLVVRRSRDLDRYRYILLLAAIGLILAPLVPGLGVDIYGERLFVHAGPIEGQPIELAKILLAIFFASYFSEKQEMLRIPTRRFGNRLVVDPAPLGPIVAAAALSLLVLVAERNVGFGILLFAFFVAIFWVATGQYRWIVFGTALFAAGLEVGIRLLPQVQERITAWIHPFSHAQTSGYQIVQGLYSLGTGGIAGTGLGLGQPRFVPFASTDMIFSIIGEELGLLGAATVVFLFLLFLGTGLRAAQQARSDFSKLLATGLVVILSMQAFFIMGGITRLFPFTGLALPFIAYGGSSLVGNYVLIAILVRISDEGNRPSRIAEAQARALPLSDGAADPGYEINLPSWSTPG